MTEISNLKLQNFLPYILSVLSNEISQNIASQYEQAFGIDMHQWRIMAILGQSESLSAGEVGRKTAMDKVAVSRGVKKLLAKKLVARQFSEHDKRRSILRLSPTGQEIYQQIVPIAMAYEEQLLASFNETELEQLTRLLAKLHTANKAL